MKRHSQILGIVATLILYVQTVPRPTLLVKSP
jgi:hypothetical protein